MSLEKSMEMGAVVVPVDNGKPDLRAYTRLKHALAEQIRAAREVFKGRGHPQALRDCDGLMAKLARDRFTLAVIGQFNRGKSSLLNAIAGREILPTGQRPLTSAITVLRFGARERLLVEHQGWSFTEEAPLEALPDYVTEKGNPGNARKIAAAYLELPVPLLRPGVEFVDTPGIGSPIEANTATTRQFLPLCDAALFVTSVEAELTPAEIDFLREARAHARKIFFVANKTDLLSAHALEQALALATRAIREAAAAEDIRLFPLSAQAGLAGKHANDDFAVAQSGLAALERDLDEFLAGQKIPMLLSAVVDKLAQLLEAAASEPATVLSPGDDAHDWERGRVAVAFIRQRLDILRAAIPATGNPRAQAGLEGEGEPADASTAGDSPFSEWWRRSAPPPDLAHDLQFRACPVCQHLAGMTADFFAHWQYALYVDERARRDHAAHRGFCPQHAWQLEALSSPVGVAVGQARLLENYARALAAAANAPSPGQFLRGLVQDQAHCRLCQQIRGMEAAYIARLAAYLGETENRDNYARAQGPCLRHLAMLVSQGKDGALAEFLLRAAAKRMEAMAGDLHAFGLKSEGLCRYLLNGDEQDAPWRAVTHLAGLRNLCLPPGG